MVLPITYMPVYEYLLMCEVDDVVLDCWRCGKQMPEDEEVSVTPEGNPHCDNCAEAWLDELRKEAQQFAIENCRLLGQVPKYDPTDPYWQELEEHAQYRRVDAFHIFFCEIRHCRSKTNYEALLDKLQRLDPIDWIYYEAIRKRINEMIAEAAGVAPPLEPWLGW